MTALHVIKIRIATAYLLAPSDTLRQLNNKDNQEFIELFEPIQTKAKENSVKLKTEIVESVMSEAGAIVTYAENENVDLIIIGSRGRSGFKKLLLGSTASGVVTYATCPVMIVKWNLADWIEYIKPDNSDASQSSIKLYIYISDRSEIFC